MSKITFKYIKKLLRKSDPVVLEIGANVGRDSKRFMEIFPNITLFCFEPDPRCIRKFKKRIDDYSRCCLTEMAIADVEGELDFHLSSGSRPGHKSTHINSSSLLSPKEHINKFPWCKFEETIKVPSITLDGWYSRSGLRKIDFIWADVQGAEEKMISGGLNTLSNTGYLYTEFSNDKLYEEQVNLSDILHLLPNFKVKRVYGTTNVLLKNTNI
jgi:2-O-methyltransferase